MWKDIIKDRRVILGAVSAGSFAVGFASGFKLVQSKVEAHYREIAEQEIREAKIFYKDGDLSTPPVSPSNESTDVQRVGPIGMSKEELVAALESMEGYKIEGEPQTVVEKAEVSVEIQKTTGTTPEEMDAPTSVGPVNVNLFDGEYEITEMDMALELPNRGPDRPYVISHDEFYENEQEFEEAHVTWYAGDEILADVQDRPIEDLVQSIGGVDNLSFGYGSKDPNVVYVCNEKIGVIFEIALSRGKYAVEVMGGTETEEPMGHGQGKFRLHD